MSTLTTYRRTLAPLIGAFEQGTAASSGNTVAALVCTSLSTTGFSFKSSVVSGSLFRDKWLHRPAAAAAADASRIIAEYTPSTGTIEPDNDWSAAPTSEVFEVLGLFSGPELNALVNLGLKRCWIVVDFTFTVTSNLYRKHSLATAAPWLTDPRWVYQVGQLVTGLDPLIYDPFATRRHGTVRKDGATVYIEGPSFNTTDTVYVKAIKPAYAHCRVTAGTFGGQSGLVLETDEAPVDETWVAWAAILAGKDRLEHLENEGQATQEARASRGMAAARFSEHTRLNFSEPERTFTPMTWMGPTRSRGW